MTQLNGTNLNFKKSIIQEITCFLNSSEVTNLVQKMGLPDVDDIIIDIVVSGLNDKKPVVVDLIERLDKAQLKKELEVLSKTKGFQNVLQMLGITMDDINRRYKEKVNEEKVKRPDLVGLSAMIDENIKNNDLILRAFKL